MNFNVKVLPIFKSLFDKMVFDVIKPYKYLLLIFIGRDIQNPVPLILLLMYISHIEFITWFIFEIYLEFSG